MKEINFQKSYSLGEEYKSIKRRAEKFLEKYLDYSGVIAFNDADKSVRFATERLIPERSFGRHPLMLLFSNPHPHSIQQGMFFSPNTKGQQSTFWSIMRRAGWFDVPESKCSPKHLRDHFLQVKYDGPFAFSFYCYYAFPTGYPDHIRKVFGESFFKRVIEHEAKAEFKKTLEQTGIESIITFNKDIFNHVAREKISTYIALLNKGKVVRGQVRDTDKDISIFLTYPTGWHYHSKYQDLRKCNLEKIREVILEDLNLGGKGEN